MDPDIHPQDVCSSDDKSKSENQEHVEESSNGQQNDDNEPNVKKMKMSNGESNHTNGIGLGDLKAVGSVKDLETVCSKADRKVSYYLNGGDVAQTCRDEECILGIDEAGRGPVLGPMVYGIAYCPKKLETVLKGTGCDDSKALTEEKRETIFDKLCSLSDQIGWEVNVISPNYISNCMLRRQKTSLNEISHNAAINLVKRALEAGAKITEIYVDTVGPAEKYEDKLKGIFPAQKVTVRSKADAIYPVVGAASIVAKVTRDVSLRTWNLSELSSRNPKTDVPWGSGYPNDPVTKSFLKDTLDPIFGFDDIVRFSWSTADKILEETAASAEWEDEEVTGKGKGLQKIRGFFSNTVDLTGKERHRFFKERQLSSATEF